MVRAFVVAGTRDADKERVIVTDGKAARGSRAKLHRNGCFRVASDVKYNGEKRREATETNSHLSVSHGPIRASKTASPSPP